MKISNNQKRGFTLAEILITLGIIGVVTAMTIPTVITNYKATRLKSQFLKSYSTIQQVFKRMQDDEISTDPNSYTDGASFYKVFASYIAGATTCFMSNSPLCPKYGTTIYGGISGNLVDVGQIILPDGTLLMFENPRNGTRILVTVDLNGIKNPPNIVGYDAFTFQLINGELHTMGDIGTAYVGEKYCNIDMILKYAAKGNKGTLDGMSCAHYAKVEPDYFKKVVKKYKY